MRIRLSRSVAGLLLLGAALPSFAQETVWVFDPPATSVQFTLGTLLHTVHGTFQLKRGTVRFDPATGKAAGELVVDAASGASGGDARDKRMHRGVLESGRFTEIAFVPDRVDGTVAPQGTSTVQVHGTFKLHGAGHELTLPMKVDRKPGGISATTQFSIPYVQWGLKDPGSLFLRVNDHVEIEIRAEGRVTTNDAGAPPRAQ